MAFKGTQLVMQYATARIHTLLRETTFKQTLCKIVNLLRSETASPHFPSRRPLFQRVPCVLNRCAPPMRFLISECLRLYSVVQSTTTSLAVIKRSPHHLQVPLSADQSHNDKAVSYRGAYPPAGTISKWMFPLSAIGRLLSRRPPAGDILANGCEMGAAAFHQS